MIRGFFLLSILIFCSTANSSELDQIIDLAIKENKHLDTQWMNALHYKEGLFFGHQSEADSESFFFHKDGKDNPKEEFRVSMKALLSELTGVADDHHQCKFPTRTKIAKRLFPSMTNKLNIKCPEYEQFKAKMGAKSVSIVFSSYYLDTPASAFGHTLMRFSKFKDPKEGESFELLDYAVNY